MKRARRAHEKVEGFTLIELLVVIAIAILASLLLPAASRTMERGRMTLCTGNVRQMTLGLMLYVNEQQYYPPLQYPTAGGAWPNSWYAALTPYLSNWKADRSPFKCPSFKYDFLTNGQAVYFDTGPYGYNGNGPYSLSIGELQGDYLSMAVRYRPFFVRDSDVQMPAGMVALGDSQLLEGLPKKLIVGSTMLSYISVSERAKWKGYPDEVKATSARHFGRHQIGFCDGHAETIRYDALFADTIEARRLWTVDHEPHPEKLK